MIRCHSWFWRSPTSGSNVQRVHRMRGRWREGKVTTTSLFLFTSQQMVLFFLSRTCVCLFPSDPNFFSVLDLSDWYPKTIFLFFLCCCPTVLWRLTRVRTISGSTWDPSQGLGAGFIYLNLILGCCIPLIPVFLVERVFPTFCVLHIGPPFCHLCSTLFVEALILLENVFLSCHWALRGGSSYVYSVDALLNSRCHKDHRDDDWTHHTLGVFLPSNRPPKIFSLTRNSQTTPSLLQEVHPHRLRKCWRVHGTWAS